MNGRSARKSHLSFNGININTVIMAFHQDIVPVMILKNNDRYKDPGSHINGFIPDPSTMALSMKREARSKQQKKSQ